MDEKYRYKILQDYFIKHGFVKHQTDSYNDCIYNGIPRVVSEADIFIKTETFTYKATFGRIHIPSPCILEEDRTVKDLYPNDARHRNINYDSPIFVDIIEEIITENNPPEVNNHKRVMIGRIPVMLRSSLCNLNKLSESERIDKGECEWDQGGYFIIKGNERAVVPQIRGIYNQAMITKQKSGDKFKYICDIRSMSEETGHSVLLQTKITTEGQIVISIPYIKSLIPIGIFFKALGFIDENDIKKLIGIRNLEGTEQYDTIERILRTVIRESYFISTQEDAFKYIGQFAMHTIAENLYTGYAKQVIENELLPHMGITSTLKEKAIFFGAIVNKVIRCFVDLRNEDDKDNYANKRVEPTGVLICELFRLLFKKFLKNIHQQIEKKKQQPDIINIISKTTVITLGLRYSFATGSWSAQKNNYVRTGVSQVLSRLSFGATLSHLRRAMLPCGKEGKNVKMRQLHSSQIMYFCPLECFDPETLILIYDRTIKIAKDVKIGDILIDDNGNPTRVKSTCEGVNIMYEICNKNKNFMNYTVTSNHILTLKFVGKNKELIQKCGYKLDESNILDINIENYLKLSDDVKLNLFGFKKNEKEYLYSSISLVKKGLGNFVGWQLEGNGRFLLHDSTVVHNTPEGGSIGIVLNFALLTLITNRIPTVFAKEVIERSKNLIFINEMEGGDGIPESSDYIRVYLNGILMGLTLNQSEFILEMKYLRSTGVLHNDISFTYSDLDNEIKIFSDEGRMKRPLFTLNEDNTLRITKKDIMECIVTKEGKKVYLKEEKDILDDGNNLSKVASIGLNGMCGEGIKHLIDWDELVEKNLIQYVDNSEIENAVVAMTENDLDKYKNDFCEISPSMMFGVMGSNIPYAEHNPAPRNIYQCLDPETNVLMASGKRKKIKDIKIGDEVVTFCPKTIKISKTKVIYQYVRPTINKIYKIRTISGREIIATENHNFMTNRGWKRVDEMKAGITKIGILCKRSSLIDMLYSIFNKDLFILREYRKIEKIYGKIRGLNTNIERIGDAIFVSVISITQVPNQLIADITVESNNHSFIAGDNFLSSNSSMGKQAMGIHALSHQVRTDTITHVLDYPQRPLVSTIPADFLGFSDMPSGINAIVAICCYSGYNQEDSIIVNKQAVERGLFVSTSYRTLVEQEVKQGPYSSESICVPPYDKRNRNANYSLLDERGIVRKRGPKGDTYVSKGDVIVGKILLKSNKLNEEQIIDRSYIIKHGEEGYIDRIIETTTSNGYKIIKIVIRNQHIPELGDKLACYSADHEILTTEGWIQVDEINLDHKVACLLDGKRLEYHNPVEIQSYEYEGKMYNVESCKVSLFVTPNHRMYTGSCHRQNYKMNLATEIYGKSRSYLNNVDEHINPLHLKSFTLPAYEKLPALELDLEAWCIFFGIWIAEGSCSISYYKTGGIHCRKVNIAANKERVKHNLDMCMKKLGLNYNYHMTKGELDAWYCNDLRLIYYLHPLSVGAINKSLPEWCFNLDIYHSRKLIEGMVLGDGCYMKGTTTERYYTSSIKLRDDFQRLCLHAGWGCNYYLKEEKGKISFILGKETKTNADYWTLTICKTQTKPIVNKYKKQDKQQDQWVDFKDYVFCCTVPTKDGIIFIRRNGKSFWCGNSRSAQKGVIGCMFPQEDLPFTKDGIVPDLLINAHCLSRETPIYLLNGLSRRIDEFSSQGFEKVIMFSDDNKNFTESFSLGMESKGIKKVLKLTMIDGRELICTPDHKIKIFKKGNYIWKESKDIDYEDQIVMGPQGTLDTRCVNESSWSLNTLFYKFDMKTNLNREKSLAFARILGYLYTNGTKSCIISMNCSYDVQTILQDIFILTGIKPVVDSLNISLPINLARTVMDLGTFPYFLYDENCPLSVIREFLAGCFGGDGWKPYINGDVFSKTVLKENEKFCSLIRKTGVNVNICENFESIIIKIESNSEFLKYIGFRHCLEKSLKLEIASSYENYCNNVEKLRIKTALEYCEMLECKYWLDKNDKDFPHFCLTLLKKEFIEKEIEVYDIGVSKFHNFLGNGLCLKNCVPSRMTLAQLMETLVGKSSAFSGEFGDGTPFTNNSINSVDKICDDLAKSGFQRQGYEVMYSGLTGEPLEALVFSGIPFYQRLKHLVSLKIHCLDFLTEVLTKIGWKKYNELSLNDEIACLKNGFLVYEKPLNILIYKDYEGLIYTVKNEYLDMKVTGNHRMFIKKKGENVFDFIKAEELVGLKGVSYKAHSILKNMDYTFPEFKVSNMKYWLIFFGIYFQIESEFEKTTLTLTLSIFIKDIMQKCLRKLGYGYKKTIYTGFYNKIVIEDENFVKYLEKFRKDILPEWIFSLSIRQVQYLLFGLSSTQNVKYGKNKFDLSFINKKIVDQVQQMCAQSDICVKIQDECDTALIFVKKEDLIVEEDLMEESLKVEKCPVFCLEVPSEVFLTRRNGKVVYTGNSRDQGRVTTLTRQPLEGRSKDGGLRFGEMERDAMISHGTSRFLKERLFEQSDPYQIYICELCGNIATTPTYCKSCESDKISKINYPYAGKVLQQNLNAMSIKTKIIVKK